MKWLLVLLLMKSTFSLAQMETDFVDIATVNSSIQIEMRYFSDWNFIGRKIAGYQANKCFLTRQAAKALSDVQTELVSQGYSLLVFDCYRPQRAVTEFLKWTQDPKDLKMKSIFYQEVRKDRLVSSGYIADKSGHSRGSTIDLTVVKKTKNSDNSTNSLLRFKEEAIDCRKQKNIESTEQLDMGTTFDCFSKLANTNTKMISQKAQYNREILKLAMQKYGFVNYPKEWWHYTLKDEPHKEKGFDFVIQ